MVHINNQNFPAVYLNTPEEKLKGMMGKDSLEGCMVFKMGKGLHSFWMKDCLIPLDIVYVMNNRISHIHPNCPVPDPHKMNPPRYSGMGDHVIEFPAGTAKNWRVGDRVAMYLGTLQNPVRPSYS
jgi:uncharacterized membrane protein (UPF0127 family)